MDKLTREDIIAMRPRLEPILSKYAKDWVVAWTDEHKRGISAIEILLKLAVQENAIKGYTKTKISVSKGIYNAVYLGTQGLLPSVNTAARSALNIFDFNPRLVEQIARRLPDLTWIWIDKNIGLTTCEKIFNELGI